MVLQQGRRHLGSARIVDTDKENARDFHNRDCTKHTREGCRNLVPVFRWLDRRLGSDLR